jgi:hypothetical protein
MAETFTLRDEETAVYTRLWNEVKGEDDTLDAGDAVGILFKSGIEEGLLHEVSRSDTYHVTVDRFCALQQSACRACTRCMFCALQQSACRACTRCMFCALQQSDCRSCTRYMFWLVGCG